MITLSVNMPRVALELPDAKEIRRNVNHNAAVVTAALVRRHFRAKNSTWWGDAANKVAIARVDEQHAVVGIYQVGVALQRFGGTVQASGRTSEVTGKPIKNLLIPVGNSALKKGKRRGGLKELGIPEESIHVVKAKSGKRYLIADKRKRGKRSKTMRDSGEMLGLLVPQATIRPHPDALPTDQQFHDAAAAGAEKALKGLQFDTSAAIRRK